MRVLHTIPSIDPFKGGPTTCTLDLLNAINQLGSSVDLATFEITHPQAFKPANWMKTLRNDSLSPLGYSANLKRFLNATSYDLYHTNGLWMYCNHITCKHARQIHRPYIITTHGMLYPTALERSHWKKWVLLKGWFNKDIQYATCIHATCYAEMEYIRQFGYKGPIAVIPNAVVIPEGVRLKAENYRDEKGRRQIGFLGRLHPIKKVEKVLYALSLLKNEGVKISELLSFQIMGRYDADYEQWLKKEITRLQLTDCVEFTGPVSGREKYERLSKLSALLVPSEQENFGMIVPEALICGTPVYASLGTPWNELNDYDAGWWRDNEPDTIASIINEILSLSDEQLLTKGSNGRDLIEKKYEQHIVAGMMIQLYEWIINNGEKPAFVYE